MKDKTLMRLMIDTPNFIREKLLTDKEIKLFKIVEGRGIIGISSMSLSCMRNIPTRTASTQLKDLYDKKYLTRKEVDSDSGGIVYVYRTAI